MASRPPEDLASTFFEFLNTDLDLATTFVQLAETELLSRQDRERAAVVLAKARKALQSIRGFLAEPGLSAEQIELVADRCRIQADCLGGVAL